MRGRTASAADPSLTPRAEGLRRAVRFVLPLNSFQPAETLADPPLAESADHQNIFHAGRSFKKS